MIAEPPPGLPSWVRAGLGRQDVLLRAAAAVVGAAIARQQTEQRLLAAIEHQALLTREVSHRVKNSLTLVSSLADEEAFERFARPQSTPFWSLPNQISRIENAGFTSTAYRLQFQQALATPLIFEIADTWIADDTLEHMASEQRELLQPRTGRLLRRPADPGRRRGADRGRGRTERCRRPG